MKKQEVLEKKDNRYYIQSGTNFLDDRLRVLNYGDTFGIFDRWGDAQQIGAGAQGIYHKGTRFISNMEFLLNGHRPLILSSNIKKENEILSVDLTNPDMEMEDNISIKKGTLHIARTIFLQDSSCHESVIVHNYGFENYDLEIFFSFNSDFKDIFEIRGTQRERNGKIFAPAIKDKSIRLSYIGLDNVKRQTIIQFDPMPDTLENNQAIFKFSLAPRQQFFIHYTTVFQIDDSPVDTVSFSIAIDKMKKTLRQEKAEIAGLVTNNEQFNNWMERSKFDLISLLSATRQGYYPYAGVPWYNTVFGRDGIITAMETLWIAPDIAKGVLTFLAKYQAKEKNIAEDAEPGKIVHEMRYGEMANTGEVPFKLYYGTIDATPLYVALAGQYLRRTDDLATIKNIWDNILRAIKWIDEYGDIDGDGFVEYEKKAENGLTNQGWKDSEDAIMHADGSLAEYPIALCEVQAYVYDAKKQASYMADRLGHTDHAKKLKREAELLKKKFNQEFWNDSLETYVLALDGKKNQCKVKASNAGHCLFCGIATPAKAKKAGAQLMSEALFNGWGIRTLGTGEVRYNPMSYHNGSVWPHDTAIAAFGLARYGMMEETMQLMEGLFNASLFIDLQRMPELFCGFTFRKGEAPTSYPVACSPQAWSVAAVFLMLQACLQITVDAHLKKIFFNKPTLPDFLYEVRIKNLKFGDDSFEIEFFRYEFDLGIHLLRKPKDWDVITWK